MSELLLHWTANPALFSFMAAIAVLFMLLMLELLFLSANLSASEWLDSLVSADARSRHPLLRGFTYPGMPLSFSVAALLATYGVFGLMLQTMAMSIQGHALPWQYAVPLPVLAALVSPKALGSALGALGLFSEDPDLERFQFIGKEAVMAESATPDAPGLAYLTDATGYRYLLRVVPGNDGVFSEKQRVRMTARLKLTLYQAEPL